MSWGVRRLDTQFCKGIKAGTDKAGRQLKGSHASGEEIGVREQNKK